MIMQEEVEVEDLVMLLSVDLVGTVKAIDNDDIYTIELEDASLYYAGRHEIQRV